MINDPIVKEVREARKKIFESYNNDIHSYLADIIKRQKKHGDRLVSRSPKRIFEQSNVTEG